MAEIFTNTEREVDSLYFSKDTRLPDNLLYPTIHTKLEKLPVRAPQLVSGQIDGNQVKPLITSSIDVEGGKSIPIAHYIELTGAEVFKDNLAEGQRFIEIVFDPSALRSHKGMLNHHFYRSLPGAFDELKLGLHDIVLMNPNLGDITVMSRYRDYLNSAFEVEGFDKRLFVITCAPTPVQIIIQFRMMKSKFAKKIESLTTAKNITPQDKDELINDAYQLGAWIQDSVNGNLPRARYGYNRHDPKFDIEINPLYLGLLKTPDLKTPKYINKTLEQFAFVRKILEVEPNQEG